jgi:pimeloyl-ACP methyl ester carboxylesterase
VNSRIQSCCQSIERPEFVRYTTEDGAVLQALLWVPEETVKTAVIYVASATGGFCGAHDLVPIARAITAAGYAFMTPNVRTIGDPNGWTYGRFEDCVPDVDAGVKYAKSRGFEDFILVGHSIGGTRAMYYWVQKREPSIRALVFMGSIVSSYGEAQFRWSAEKKAEYEAFLVKVREMVRQGRGEEVVTFKDFFAPPVPPMITASARSVLSFFGAPHECNSGTAKYGAELTVPALVVHSAEDTIATPKNAEAIYESLTAAPLRELIWVGGGHMLSDPEVSKTYGEAIAGWISRVVPPKR